jgi:uncharacterized phage-like protein YoqJ
MLFQVQNPDEIALRLASMAFTGHRPKRFTPEVVPIVQSHLVDLVKNAHEIYKVDEFISGMALGVDQWAAQAVLHYRESHPEVKLIAAVPFAAQSNLWQEEDRKAWRRILKAADEIWLTDRREQVDLEEMKLRVRQAEASPLTRQAAAMLLDRRNRWMVDHTGQLHGIWDEQPSGGTYNCIRYARKVGREVHFFNPFAAAV